MTALLRDDVRAEILWAGALATDAHARALLGLGARVAEIALARPSLRVVR